MFGWLKDLFGLDQSTHSCGTCGRVSKKKYKDAISYLGLNQCGQNQLYSMDICPTCAGILEYLKKKEKK